MRLRSHGLHVVAWKHTNLLCAHAGALEPTILTLLADRVESTLAQFQLVGLVWFVRVQGNVQRRRSQEGRRAAGRHWIRGRSDSRYLEQRNILSNDRSLTASSYQPRMTRTKPISYMEKQPGHINRNGSNQKFLLFTERHPHRLQSFVLHGKIPQVRVKKRHHPNKSVVHETKKLLAFLKNIKK